MEISDVTNERARNKYIEDKLKRRTDAPEDVIVLELLAFTRFATSGQLCRVFYNNQPKDECKRLRKLLRKNLVGKITNVEIRRGRHKGKKTWVYFLTEEGRKEVRDYLGVPAIYAKTGYPDKITHQRINHQLLVTEMYLYYHERYTIYECRNEDSLKSEIQHAKKARREKGFDVSGMSESVADFKIGYIDFQTGIAETVELEACVEMSAKQILAKKSFVKWFVLDKSQARIIFREKHAEAIVADDILAPYEAENIMRPANNSASDDEIERTDYAKMILELLEKVGGGATKDFIKLQIGLKDTKLSVILESLTAAGKIFKTTTALLPGTSRGRNLSFYALRQENLTNNRFLTIQTIRSYAARHVADKDYELSFCISECLLQFKGRTNREKMALLYVIPPVKLSDHPGFLSGFELNIEEIKKDNNPCEVFIATTDNENAYEIKKDFSPGTAMILDYSTARQSQSYRYKTELQCDAIVKKERRVRD